ncbi:beta-N-acetylglucosaminidase domain-containing protein [Streptomyces sp. JJ36]|nr:beta-N-acetylglucosaminidase domain-containing protein [Streptomyces sp. JJ36]
MVAGVVSGLLGGAPAAHATAPGADAATAPEKERTGHDALPTVWPRPQSLRAGGAFVPVGTQATLVAGPDADPYALDVVRATLRRAGAHTLYEVRPGERPGPRGPVVRVGAAAGDALRSLDAPERGDLPAGGYRLATGRVQGRGTVALSGTGTDGLFHAAQTLRQLVTEGPGGPGFPGVSVRDWPTAPVRGVTEGFYGEPWSHRDRLAQLDFLGRTKQNRYLYAPGGDPYRQAAQWRDPYPADRRAEFRELAARAKANHVVLAWAVSPGQSLCFSSADDRRALLRKVDAMRALGVGAFQLRFDDVSYEEWHCEADADAYGTGPEAAARAQAELANAVAGHLAARPGAAPLSVLPTEFYQEGRTAYRSALARTLHDGVEIAWTGVGVVPRTITGGELAGARTAFPQHRLVTQDNYPVNDYAPERLFLGPYQGREPAVATGSAALLANAMEQPTASRIPLFTAADFAWNPRDYRPQESWRAAVDAVAGTGEQARAAVHALAANDASSMLDAEESAYLRPLIERFRAAYASPGDDDALTAAADRLRRAFRTLQQAPGHVPDGLAAETAPWLEQLARFGTAGERSVDMLLAQARGDGAAAWEARLATERLRAESRRSRVTVGKGVLGDFVDTALRDFERWSGAHAPTGSPSGDAGGKKKEKQQPAPDVSAPDGGPAGRPGHGLRAAVDGDPATAYRARTAPAGPPPRDGSEVPAPPDALTVPLERTRALRAVTVLSGPGTGTRGTVEAHVPGEGWRPLGRLSESGWTEADAAGVRADALRLRWQEGSRAPVVHEITPWYADAPEVSLGLSRDDVYASTGGEPARITARLTSTGPADTRARLRVDAPEGFTVHAPSRVTVARGTVTEAEIELRAGEDVRTGTHRVPVTFGDQRTTLTVRAFPPTGGPDLARDATATSSGDETPDFPASAVNDGDPETRWSSPAEDGAWVQLALARPARVGELRLHWQEAYGEAYRVQVSPDGRRWRTAATVRDGRGGRETVRMDAPADTRFVRIQGMERATRFGYSLWSVEAYAVRGADDGASGGADGSRSTENGPGSGRDGTPETDESAPGPRQDG